MTSPDAAVAAVLDFWRSAGIPKWFTRDAAFDAELRGRFLDTHFAAARGEFDHWAEREDGALALLLLLDQVPRNAFRDSAHAYATDPLARHAADRAIAAGHDRKADSDLRVFFYLPFEHSEALADQDRALLLIEPLGEQYLRHALIHHDVIARFGRFPHRNRALGRITTTAEQSFLEEGGFTA